VVASIRALKVHGGVAKADLGSGNPDAVTKGLANLQRHLKNIARFGVPAMVCLNRFGTDSDAEIAAAIDGCKAVGVTAFVCEHWAKGGKGAVELARAVVAGIDEKKADFKPLYPDTMPLLDKIRTIAEQIYGAAGIEAPKAVTDRLKEIEQMGFAHLPICMAKTQYSFTADPDLRGAPSGFTLPIREIRLSAGAEFVIALCGDVMTMPGLPRVPSAAGISVSAEGRISGLS
jgi:formate--tetrahydrofolate ligase